MTTPNSILVLGASGAVGHAAANVLIEAGARVTVAGRHVQRLREIFPAAVDHRHVDLELADGTSQQTNPLNSLLQGFDVVVSCAGPAHRFSSLVARAAMANGVDMVDAGGEEGVSAFGVLARQAGCTLALGAGVQPGLTGVVLDQTVRLLEGHTSRGDLNVSGWCGGLQPLTLAAVEEYVWAAEQSGGAGIMLKAGHKVKARPEDAQPVPPPFSHTAEEHVHLDPECAEVAAELGVRDVRWANVIDGAVSRRVLQRCLSGELTVDAAVEAARTDLFGVDPYFHLLVEARAGLYSAWARLSCRDSYRVSGHVVAQVALHLPDWPEGAHLASSLLRGAQMWEQLGDSLPDDADLRCGLGNTSTRGAGASSTACEEGEL